MYKTSAKYVVANPLPPVILSDAKNLLLSYLLGVRTKPERFSWIVIFPLRSSGLRLISLRMTLASGHLNSDIAARPVQEPNVTSSKLCALCGLCDKEQ